MQYMNFSKCLKILLLLFNIIKRLQSFGNF